jgi:CTP:molybdopterin cytidylyltransferase MocA
VNRVAAIIFHQRPEAGAGPLTRAFVAIRRQNADRQAIGFGRAGAEAEIVDDPGSEVSYGQRVREAVAARAPDGIVLLGSGSIPLATPADRRTFVATAAGPTDHALANNRYSADIVAVAGSGRLARLPDLRADNGLPRWLAESGGFEVADVRRRWRLQVDLDSPFDALLVGRGELDGIETEPARSALAAVEAVGRDPGRELAVAGRGSAAGLAWLEQHTASRTRALIEERGFRTWADGQRAIRSSLGLLLDRDGPGAFGTILAELGDAAIVDTRVLLAHRFGVDERGWPIAEDRFASDLLLPDRILDPWLRALTRSAIDGPIPVVLGGHSLVGPGLRLVFGRARSWT